jgi:hypothetical protein
MTRLPDSREIGGFTFEAMDTLHSQRVRSSTALIDLRKDPRVDTRLPVELFTGAGDHVLAIISNLSRSGLRLEGSRQMVDALVPDDRLQDGHTPVDLLAVFTVPDATSHPAEIKVRCRSVYTRQASPDCWHIGMRFTAFNQGRNALDSFLTSKGIRP